MFFEKVFLGLSDSILIEEIIKDFLRIPRLVSWHENIPFDRSNLPEVDSWGPKESTREEERIIKVKEISKDSPAHLVSVNFLIMNYKQI